MFGRATIRLGIGPHSSSRIYRRRRHFCVLGRLGLLKYNFYNYTLLVRQKSNQLQYMLLGSKCNLLLLQLLIKSNKITFCNTDNKSSAVAEMGDRGQNRHGPKRGGGCCAPFAGRWDPV